MLKELLIKEYQDQGYVLANDELEDVSSGTPMDVVVIRADGRVEAKSGLVTRASYWNGGPKWPAESSVYFLGDYAGDGPSANASEEGEVLLYRKANPLPRDREELIAQAMTVFPGADVPAVVEWLNAILAKHEQMILVQATDWDSSSLHC